MVTELFKKLDDGRLADINLLHNFAVRVVEHIVIIQVFDDEADDFHLFTIGHGGDGFDDVVRTLNLFGLNFRQKHIVQGVEKLFDVHRFNDVVVHAQFNGIEQILGVGKGGCDDGRNFKF